MRRIKGTVRYQNIATGFWGIIDEQGNQWRPIEMPEQLKIEGKKVHLTINEIEEGFSIFMWGTAVELVTFHT